MENNQTEPVTGQDAVTVTGTEPVPMDAVDLSALKRIVEALLLGTDEALPLDRMLSAFPEAERPDRKALREALELLKADYADRAAEVREVASGWRIQVREAFGPYIAQLQNEKPVKYSRALLETLSLIAYRQPITRGEVEEIRGVTLSPSILKTLTEREWVKTVGVREVPGRPELLGTTKIFLDDFGLKSLESLPSLPEIRDLDALANTLERLQPTEEMPAAEMPATEISVGSGDEPPAGQIANV